MEIKTLNIPKPDKAIIITVFGIRGSGKSYLTTRIADSITGKDDRMIIFDVADEWGGPHVKSYEAYLAFREKYPKHKAIVIKFDLETPIEIMTETVTEIVKEVYREGHPTTLIFEEAQIFFPVHGTEPVLQRLVMIGRHRNISIVANTQRPAQVYKGLLSQSEHVYCGKLFEKNDIQYLSGTIGKKNAETLPTLKDHIFIEFTAGNIQENQVFVKA